VSFRITFTLVLHSISTVTDRKSTSLHRINILSCARATEQDQKVYF
jgi:hypothetical protein